MVPLPRHFAAQAAVASIYDPPSPINQAEMNHWQCGFNGVHSIPNIEREMTNTADRTCQQKVTRLVITADDFGLAEEVNDAVAIAHREGVLKCASLMAGGSAADHAVKLARTLPGLRVGLHIVLVDGFPLLPRRRIPDLVDDCGQFRSDLARLAVEIMCSRALREQLRAEITAQFEAYARTGLRLDHADVHKHFHLHPIVADAVIAIGKDFGMQRLRVPAEPISIIHRVDPNSSTSHKLLSPWVGYLRSQCDQAGLIVPDAVFGLAWSGQFNSRRLLGLVRELPHGLVEIYTHPATSNTFASHAAGYDYRGELDALCDPATVDALQTQGICLDR